MRSLKWVPLLLGPVLGVMALAHCSVKIDSALAFADAGTDGGAQPSDNGRGGTVDKEHPCLDVRCDPPVVLKDGGVAGRTVYAVSASSKELLKFSTSSPGDTLSIPVTGIAEAEVIQGIDFRPKTGGLYAFTSEVSAAAVYEINTSTGVATKAAGNPVGTYYSAPLDTTSKSWGVDFDPIEDRLRIIASNGQMYRLNPENGKSVNPTSPDPATYGGGAAATLVGTAFTNSIPIRPSKTVLYGIDSEKNVLAVFKGSPNTGVVEEVGPLGVDPTQLAGFDIYGGTDKPNSDALISVPLEAYAAMSVKGITSLYGIDLATGRASSLGIIGTGLPVRGIAVEPAKVPE